MTATSGIAECTYDHDDFDSYAKTVQGHFDRMIANGEALFTVEADGLFEAYLDGFAVVRRQVHNCNCCKGFIRRYGNLVTIDDKGEQHSALWDAMTVPAEFKLSTDAMARIVKRAPVTGVFVTDEKVWGTAQTGVWHHFSINVPPARVHKDRLNTAYQVAALKKQDYGTLSHGLADFDLATVKTAVSLLEAESLYRSEKVLGPAQFLLGLHNTLDANHKSRRRNLIWRAVASAPVGFATPRSSMIGTLLEDIKSGMDIASVKKRFATKMNPTQYMRPQAPASAGNIAAAEKLVEQLGIAPSLERRFARLDEVKTIWKPTPIKEKEAGGVFGHLKPKAAKAAPVVAPVQDITWSKFARTVLPKALEILVHLRDQSYPLVGCLTAVHFDAPPILQWDSEENRNPFSWYLYTGGSRPRDWNLAANTWTKVNAVMLKPSMWAGEDKFTHQGTGAVFILDGAKDSRTAGACLFPEILKSELHAIRSTIESFSHRAKLEGREEGDANGILIGQKNDGATIRVTTELGVADYRIDRWD